MLFFGQTFEHSSAHTLLVVILERLKVFCELSVREPFSSLDGLVEWNLNKKEWQYRAWNFIKRTFLKCCTLLTGGKKPLQIGLSTKTAFWIRLSPRVIVA